MRIVIPLKLDFGSFDSESPWPIGFDYFLDRQFGKADLYAFVEIGK